MRGCAWGAIGIAAVLMGRQLATDPLVKELSPSRLDAMSIALAGAACILSQLIYFSRWHWFLRTAQAPLPWVQVVLTGLIAQMLGTLGIGSVGSDVYRGVVTEREWPKHRVAIVGSIIADRVAGLYALFCVAALAATFTPGLGRWQLLRTASMPVLWTTVAIGGIVILAGLFCNFGPSLACTRSFPRLYRFLALIFAAVDLFRGNRKVFAFGIASGMVVHMLNAATLWLVARGLGVRRPTLAEHFLISTLATSTGLIPLPMAGLGAVELIIEQLYRAAVPGATGAGLLAALGTRLLGLGFTILLAAVFMPLSRRLHP